MAICVCAAVQREFIMTWYCTVSHIYIFLGRVQRVQSFKLKGIGGIITVSSLLLYLQNMKTWGKWLLEILAVSMVTTLKFRIRPIHFQKLFRKMNESFPIIWTEQVFLYIHFDTRSSGTHQVDYNHPTSRCKTEYNNNNSLCSILYELETFVHIWFYTDADNRTVFFRAYSKGIWIIHILRPRSRCRCWTRSLSSFCSR